MSRKTKEAVEAPKKAPKKRVNGTKKGKSYERQVANEIGHIFPEAQRHLEYQVGEQEGVDLQGTGIFKIQTKFRQNYVPIGAIREVRIDDPSHIPVLVTKGNHREPMAVLPWKKFVTILEVVYGLELQWELPKSKIHNPALAAPSEMKLVSPPISGPKKGKEGYVQHVIEVECEVIPAPSFTDFY